MNREKVKLNKGQAQTVISFRRTTAGQAMITAVVFFLFVSITVTLGITGPVYREVQLTRDILNSKESFYLSESGQEDVIYRLKNGLNVSSVETLTIASSTVTTTVVDNAGRKIITSSATSSSFVRKIKSELIIGAGVTFNYGIQVGEGGLYMKNNSSVIGNIFSNGPVTADNSPIINGDAISAGLNGLIDDMEVTGDAYANTITSSIIGGDAYYQTIFGTTVSGTEYPGSPDQATTSMSIPDSLIEQWTQDAEAGGVIGSQTYSSGIHTLGPVKIDGNLKVKNSAELVLMGTVWVTGEVDIINFSIVRLDSSYGNQSGVMISGIKGNTVAGQMEIENNAQVLGSGSPNSHLMLISQRVGNVDAFDLEGISQTSVVYAPYGRIEVANNINVKSIAAWKVDISNNAEVTYESGLANLLFSSGPSGGYSIESWKEVE